MRPSRLLFLFSTVCLGSPFAPAAPKQAEVPFLLPESKNAVKPSDALAHMTTALETMQSKFFNYESGTYSSGINWTRAVFGTFLAACTKSLSAHKSHKHLADRYFAEVVAFFYGQDMGLKNEAFDDILWVVLQWIEAVKMIDYRVGSFSANEWTGKEWKGTFAARALEFYKIAETGWDEKLCRGGMIWSPWLEPYKNAITNELYISASAAMYLYHPTHNATYLENAKKAFSWLRESNMQNAQGLYADGFHISRFNSTPGVGENRCDKRDEQVYTYNQGVLLSGLRGLAESTGEREYLEEGFELIDAVLTSEGKVGEIISGGILTEKCDPKSYCSQNGQTFKGIFMHHLTLFCAPLSSPLVTFTAAVQSWHEHSCSQYHRFILKNAAAAWGTKNSKGVIGAWWGAPDACGLPYSSSPFWSAEEGVFKTELDPGATDHMNPILLYFRGEGGEDVGVQGDLNDRGRGRTVESHSGGLAALRAVLEVVV